MNFNRRCWRPKMHYLELSFINNSGALTRYIGYDPKSKITVTRNGIILKNGSNIIDKTKSK